MMQQEMRPWWLLPGEEEDPEQGQDPALQPPPGVRPPTALSRFDASSDANSGATPTPDMSVRPPIKVPPNMGDDIGRDPRYRDMRIKNLEMQDDQVTAPPDMGFGQGDLAQAHRKSAMDLAALAGKKSPWWQVALQSALTRDIRPLMQNGKLAIAERRERALRGAADEERKQQQNAAMIANQRDARLTNQTNRRWQDENIRSQIAAREGAAADRVKLGQEQDRDRLLKYAAANAAEIPDQTTTQGIPDMTPGPMTMDTGMPTYRAPMGQGPIEKVESTDQPTITPGLPANLPGSAPMIAKATLPAEMASPADAFNFRDPVTKKMMSIPKNQGMEVDKETGEMAGIVPQNGKYFVPKGQSLAQLIKAGNPTATKGENLEDVISTKTKIADANNLKGAERQHWIYGTPMPSATQGGSSGPSAPPVDFKPGTREFKIAQDLAYGKLTMQQFRSMLSYSRDVNKKMDIYSKASELNPNFIPANFEMGFTLAKNPKVQQQLAAMDNVQAGIPDLLRASEEAKRSGVTMLNKFIIPGGIAFGSKKYSNLAAARLGFADELSGALGFGSATDMSRQMGLDMTNPNLSHENFMAAVQDVVLPFVQRKRSTLLKQMGVYGEKGMNPAAEEGLLQGPPTGGTVRYISGGTTYNIPAVEEADFLKAHKDARRQ